MSKPEGSAQEPQYNCAHHGIQRGSYCIKCGAICVPATPAPSQPARAREWFMARRKMDAYISFDDMEEYAQFVTRQQTAAKDAELTEWRSSDTATMLREKNAEISSERDRRVSAQEALVRAWRLKEELDIEHIKHATGDGCACELCETVLSYTRQHEPTPQEIIAAYDRAIKDKEAAERERDSLREANARLAADLDAALRPGSRTAEQYRAALIIAAQKRLATITQCPNCNSSDRAKDVTGSHHDSSGMDIHLDRCEHPWHNVRYEDGSYEMLSMGLPNYPQFDKGWVKEMQKAAFQYELAALKAGKDGQK